MQPHLWKGKKLSVKLDMKWHFKLGSELLFFNRLNFFRVVFRFIAKLREKLKTYLWALCTYTCVASPSWTSPAGGVHLLPLVNLHWHVIIAQSSEFTFGSLSVSHILWVWLDVYDMCPPLQHHTEKLHCPKNPVLCLSFFFFNKRKWLEMGSVQAVVWGWA